jgi:hypothetical protein
MNPAEFWGDNVGRFLCPSVPVGQDLVTFAVGRNYKLADKDSEARLGSIKAASLAVPGDSVMMAGIRPDHPVPPQLTLRPGSWRTIPNWIAEIVTDPPPPPFMFVVHGKNPYMQDRWRLNLSSDVVEVCGAQSLRCRPAVVRKALEAIGDMPPAVWRKAAFLADMRDRNQLAAERIDEQLAKMETKHPGLSDLLDALPSFGSGDYEATTLVHAVRSKADAARPAA